MLTILENSAFRVVAEQSPHPMLLIVALPVMIAAGAALLMLSRRRWILGGLSLVLLAFFLFMGRPGITYRVAVDGEAHRVSWQAIKSGKVLSREELAAADISSADMEFNRDARTIILLGRDGNQYYPIGDQHFSGGARTVRITDRDT